MTLSPGHGIFWNGTGWYTQRPAYCLPLNQEDYHDLEMGIYLKSHLEADGMLIKPVREFDKSVCCYPTGNAWWQMSSPYYLQWKGYPCDVYASYTGDCTLGTADSELNDDIRARPLASNLDNTTINESAQSSPAVMTTPANLDVIVDNPAASFTGTWSLGTSSVDKYGADYRYISTATSETGTATFRPTIEVAGYYNVYCWYPQGSNRTTKAPYTVYWNGGQQTIAVNQQVNGGKWNLLVASKPFLAGTTGYVKLSNATSESSLVVLADAVRFLKVEPDLTPPVISSVASTVGTGSAVVTWTTNEAATSQVEYGTTTAYGSLSPLDPNLVTAHSVSLSSLARRTTYHYRVRSKDAAGNEAISGDYTFKTK